MTADVWKVYLKLGWMNSTFPLGDLPTRITNEFTNLCCNWPISSVWARFVLPLRSHDPFQSFFPPNDRRSHPLPFFHIERLDGMLLIFQLPGRNFAWILQELSWSCHLKMDELIAFFASAGMEFSTSRGIIKSFQPPRPLRKKWEAEVVGTPTKSFLQS